MGELSLVMGGLARVMVFLGGGLCTVMVAYVGILMMTSAGDPQSMARARMALLAPWAAWCLSGLGSSCPGW